MVMTGQSSQVIWFFEWNIESIAGRGLAVIIEALDASGVIRKRLMTIKEIGGLSLV